MTPAYQFCQLQRITGYSELLVTETWYRTQLPMVIWLQRILRPVSGLDDMAMSQATTRQPSLITPHQPVIGAGLALKDNRFHPCNQSDRQTQEQRPD